MNRNKEKSQQTLEDLRRRAEVLARHRADDELDLSSLSAAEIRALIHELEVHRIELEMQNDELRQTHAALELARDRYSDLFDMAPIGYFILDERGQIEQINITGAQLLGLDRAQLATRRLYDFVAKKDHDIFFRHLRRSFSQVGRERCEVEMLRVGGMTFHVHVESVSQQDDDGRISQCLTVILDITERKQAEEKLREADRRKDEFLATLAHELRNPLAPISNALHILNQTHLPEGYGQRARDMMDRQLRHMVRLIDDLLDVSRITGSMLQLRKQQVDLTEVLGHALDAVKPQIEDAEHVVTLVPAKRKILLEGDPVRLTQVFVNLLNNACTYTERGGEIRVTTVCDGGKAVVTVSDTGIGIAPRDRPHLFGKFSYLGAASNRNRKQTGLGLGLWLSRGLVELHGGHIEASSDGPGKGSEFSVHLPVLMEQAAAAPSREVRPATTQRKTPLRILVADDNEDAVESLALLLEADGYLVETARDGLAAVKVAERFRPDAILLDIGMPRLDGYGACRRIRELPWGADILIVALTGWGQEDDRRMTEQAGFNAHLVKPVAPEAITQTLVEQLADRQ